MVYKYRFGFVLSTALGNITRYINFRKYAERDGEIDFTWAPVKHYLAPDEPDPFWFLPTFLRKRAIVFHEAAPVIRRLSSFDAVMIHMYEVDILTALRGYFAKAPIRVISTDDAPVVDPATYPLHPVEAAKPAWRKRLRLAIDLWRARRADLLIPFSRWAANILVQGARVQQALVVPVHVGLDLELWTYQPKAAQRDGLLKVLFVGGDFQRKGGDQLLHAFNQRLSGRVELHLVTKSAPKNLPADVYVYPDLSSNSQQLIARYRDADIFVLPTTSDLSPWVVLEAMACGCPVVVTPIGGIIDLVEEGVTGMIVPVGDAEALAQAILRLAGDPTARLEMGRRAREFIERDFDAAKNVPKILSLMKNAVDDRRRGSLVRV